jgi:hypothetical protein
MKERCTCGHVQEYQPRAHRCEGCGKWFVSPIQEDEQGGLLRAYEIPVGDRIEG